MPTETIRYQIEHWGGKSGWVAVRYIDHVPCVVTRRWDNRESLFAHLTQILRIDPTIVQYEKE